MLIGAPSSGKSPGLDAVLAPLMQHQTVLQRDHVEKHNAWRDESEIAKLAEANWKEAVKTAIKEGKELLPKPRNANAGPEPLQTRLSVSDATVERLAVISAQQQRGLLLTRDELSGWLQNMSRYSSGSDRPFWLEAYGGRAYVVERMGRLPVNVKRLFIGVVGGIQPDRLSSLLLNADDDGLLARFIPTWPNPVPILRPTVRIDAELMTRVLGKLISMDLVIDETGEQVPRFLPFSEEAQALLHAFRQKTRDLEGVTEGLLLPFIGKLPGLSVRLSLVIAFLDWAVGSGDQPKEITGPQFARATLLVETYFLPMARRAYGASAVPKVERGARRLVSLVQDKGWDTFSTRDVLRCASTGLKTRIEIDPVLRALEEGGCIRPEVSPRKAEGGRPERRYLVNPAVLAPP